MRAVFPFLDLLRQITVVVTLAIAGYTDYRKREIDDKVWVLGGLVVAPLVLLQVYSERLLELYAVSLLAGVLTALFTLKFELMGEADAIALVFIAFAEPPNYQNVLTLIPFAAIVLLAGVSSLGFIAYNVYFNLREHASFPASTPFYLKLIAMTSMRLISREEYDRKRYMYAPVDTLTIQSLLKTQQTVETPGKDKFWALVYLPYVTLLSIGYLIYLVLSYAPLN